jgi:hypothetical protein
MAKSHAGKRFLLISILCLLITVILWIGIALGLYGLYFGRRSECRPAMMRHVYEFDGLERTRYEFLSDKGQTLTGYMYSAGDVQRGIIVFAHGYGDGGHNYYMEDINYLAQNGYYVFAYDATGCDESGGDGIGGVPQGVIDLENAISFVEGSGNFPELPIGLFGHSWGGYSVSSVLTYHPEVKAVIECSGPCSSTGLLEGGGKNTIGPAVYLFIPVLKVYERAKFGDYATNSALDGFASTDADIMVVHSSDDGLIPVEYGYDIYYEIYKDDPRFTFVRLEGKGHNQFLNVSRNTDLFRSFVEFYDKNLFE